MNSPSPRSAPPAVLLVLALLAVPASGCVITDTPQFQVPQHTAPFLVASTASPDVRQVVTLDLTANMPIKFSADVISQDDPLGSTGPFQTVSAELYIDYGFPATPTLPFRFFPIPGDNQLSSGTLDQTTGRNISATWDPRVDSVLPGCHTATLIVSHLFDGNPGCPRCDDDFSSLTWQVIACNSPNMPGMCGDLPVNGMTTTGLEPCPVPGTNNCDAADPAAKRMCPESTADAGAP